MLKNKTKRIIILFLALILLFSSTFVMANNEANENEIMPISSGTKTDNSVQNTIENNQTQKETYKKSDVYLVGDNITVDYIVDGNLFVCANTVTIDSQIGGDAFIMAKNLIINKNAYVFNNLFTISNSVEIKGVVYDVYALANTLTISSGYIYRDIKVSCNTLNINGVVGRNAFVSCSNINFNTDNNTNGIIHGNLDYTSNSEISIPENVVFGSVNYTPMSITEKPSVQSIIADYLLNLGEFLSFVLIIWLICLMLAPKFLNNTNDFVGKQTLKILGNGLLGLIAIPVACIILILLQLTSGFSIFLLAIYILAIVVSKSLFAIVANNYVCSKLNISKTSGTFGMLIISGIVIWLITKIAYVGGVISFIITVLGLGVLITSILPKKANKTDKKEEK